jgi:hypothetical protein
LGLSASAWRVISRLDAERRTTATRALTFIWVSSVFCGDVVLSWYCSGGTP